MDLENPVYEYLKFDPQFNFLLKLTESPAPNAAKGYDPFMAISYFVIGPDDELVYGYPIDYTIQVFSPEGKLLHKITRDYSPVEVTEEEIKSRKEGLPPELKFTPGKYHSAYWRFEVDEVGRLYVQTWEKDPEGRTYHDLFDEKGRYLTRFLLKGSPLLILKNKLYCQEEDEEGYEHLIRYRLTFTPLDE